MIGNYRPFGLSIAYSAHVIVSIYPALMLTYRVLPIVREGDGIKDEIQG